MLTRENIELLTIGLVGFMGMELLNQISKITGIVFGLGVLILATMNYLSGQKRRKNTR
ncbi:MAG: hypothetical protein OXC61_04400 [Flavobacteriaceae bacterium]|nr:hypothetical protein [Flavobacteriaceae bacterium]